MPVTTGKNVLNIEYKKQQNIINQYNLRQIPLGLWTPLRC